MAKPILAAIYGPPGRGKSVASIRAFSNGLFLGPPNAFLPARTFLGINLGSREKEIYKFSDIFSYLEKLPELKKVKELVISDVSILLDAEYKHLKKSKSEGGMGIVGWDIYTEIEKLFSNALEIIRELPQHTIMEFHEMPAKTVNKTGKVESSTFIAACPQVPGLKLPPTLSGYFDTVAQVVPYPEDTIGKFIWPFCLSVAPSEEATRKDRNSVFPPFFPLNVREPLLLNGLAIERAEEVKWLDDAIEPVARNLLALRLSNELTKPTVSEILKEVLSTHKDKDNKHVRWLINDCFDRAEVLYYKQTESETLINNILKGI